MSNTSSPTLQHMMAIDAGSSSEVCQETEPLEYDIICPAIGLPSPSIMATTCLNRLVLEEICQHCKRCKVGTQLTAGVKPVDIVYPVKKKPKGNGTFCSRCGKVELYHKMQKFCSECKIYVDKETQANYRAIHGNNKTIITEDDFNIMYWDKSMTIPNIAEKLSVNKMTLYQYVKRKGFNLRTMSQAGILRENKEQRTKRSNSQ